MDALTELIRTEIKRQYKSVRKFAIDMGIAPSTLISALNKGIGGTSFDTVVNICEVLGIKTVLSEKPIYLDQNTRTIIEGYNALDERGKHSINMMLQLELMRCSGSNSIVGNAAAYGGAEAETSQLDKDEQSAAVEALRSIRKNTGLE